MRDGDVSARGPRHAARSFYVWMAAACLAIAVAGFAPTYWLQLPAGTFVGSPLLHLHGLLFTAWPVYVLAMSIVAARGRVARHRAWGLLGISLATAMVFTGIAVVGVAIAARTDAGHGERARAFHIASTSMMVLFAGFVTTAIAAVTRPEIHKRAMVLASIATLPPAVARLFLFAKVGMVPGLRPGSGAPRSVADVLPATLVADALILAGILHDVRTRGRPHPVYVIGGAIMVAVHVLRIPASTTAWWHTLADLLGRFAG